MCMKIMLGVELPASVASWCSTRVPRVIAGVPPAMVAFVPWYLGVEKSVSSVSSVVKKHEIYETNPIYF